MAAFVKSLVALFFFICVVHGGSSICTNANLKINQVWTGTRIEGKSNFEVSIENTCSCVFVDVVLSCDGFQPQEPIDNSILKKDGSDCTINNGNAIAPSSTFKFKYSSDKMYNFSLKNSQIACS
ncbi:uncharacterized protein [Spinacia oleracea]|uniref:Uncharacterized protein n=1 Tax=Spinacia oleracea TaxID=3562 RepID=A0A9R0I6D9_SPIOL|nr:uncharacterized protein LOC110783077 [Spinacia oleracea]